MGIRQISPFDAPKLCGVNQRCIPLNEGGMLRQGGCDNAPQSRENGDGSGVLDLAFPRAEVDCLLGKCDLACLLPGCGKVLAFCPAVEECGVDLPCCWWPHCYFIAGPSVRAGSGAPQAAGLLPQ